MKHEVNFNDNALIEAAKKWHDEKEITAPFDELSGHQKRKVVEYYVEYLNEQEPTGAPFDKSLEKGEQENG